MDDVPRSKFVRKGDIIKSGHKKSYILKSRRSNAKVLEIRVFVSNEMNPQYVDDVGCAKLGTLTIPLDGKDVNPEIDVSLLFSDTELHVTACDCTNKIKYTVSFDLLSERINFS